MAEIPVEHKAPAEPRSGFPILPVAGVVAILGLIGLVLGLRHCGEDKTSAGNTAVTAPSGRCGSDVDCGERQLCVGAACVDIKAGLAECAAAQVHFDTDSADIRAADKPAVDRMARCLKADQSMKMTIAGSADERGTSDHNADLGEKRAISVARALQAQGVSGKQLSVVSYGDNHPLCLDSDRDCWAKNRQASLTPH